MQLRVRVRTGAIPDTHSTQSTPMLVLRVPRSIRRLPPRFCLLGVGGFRVPIRCAAPCCTASRRASGAVETRFGAPAGIFK